MKRGDQIKRGQVIAQSGQTGNVNAPQSHFEVRRGATPLDPVLFLKANDVARVVEQLNPLLALGPVGTCC